MIKQRDVIACCCYEYMVILQHSLTSGQDGFALEAVEVDCMCCGSILSLVHFLFPFMSDSLSYNTIHKNKGK